ncbi:galactose mutarotase [Salinicoccus sp. ID82-1]|uniref:aldose epimerase family protein n=1 Tax=Salinicoccus sp. ID82-1 TaxID=2820269 RepID=UPI001F2678C2|nr:aldose epimerase family protein [Salinicoccus sp. ID82-1]MCG1008461.1 galactose mutarotase [Salinicoccus sp. ID82-1]
MKVVERRYDGDGAADFTKISITNGDTRISFLNYGARVCEWIVPDKNGVYEDILLGHEDPADYLVHPYYFGASIGRTAGRIRNGEAVIGDTPVKLTINDGPHHLHGGSHGFDTLYFDHEIEAHENEITIIFTSTLKDMADGYPGNLDIDIRYTYSKDDRLTIDYRITTDKETLINPTNHMYFNLNGNLKDDIKNHTVNLGNAEYGKVDGLVLPLGESGIIESNEKNITFRELIESEDPQFSQFNGLDHPFNMPDGPLVLRAPNGRSVTLESDDPVVVVFTSNDFSFCDVSGKHFYPYCGLTLEAQMPPDDINTDRKSETILPAGGTFTKRTVYQFNIQ